MKLELCYALCCGLAVTACVNRGHTGDDHSGAGNWFSEGTWREGWEIEADESLDVSEFSTHYSANPERWEKAFHYLATTDLAYIEPGRYELDGTDLFVIVDQYVAKDEENTRFEAHKVYADIQYVVDGREQIGVASMKSLEVVEPYDQTRDIAFFRAQENNYRLATPDRFFVFFPDDAHRPGFKVADGEQVKKIVVKVKL